ncbi:hypothetical protein G9A89_015659 [Geosiphon pyriformis]|nr:hypothetical protein G9A89_015659 [Geosiphon pyriformis]
MAPIYQPQPQDYLSLLVTPEDASPSNQEPTQNHQTRTSNILPTIVTNDKLLNAIFPFKLKELSTMPLLSGATLEEKPITAMYTDNTQELQLSQNGRHMQVPAICGHFKTTNTTASLINFEEEKPKPIWEAYQVLWADEEHNELPPILS